MVVRRMVVRVKKVLAAGIYFTTAVLFCGCGSGLEGLLADSPYESGRLLGEGTGAGIESFSIISDNPGINRVVTVELQVSNARDIGGYYISDSDVSPEPGSSLWQDECPASVLVSSPPGQIRLYAWILDTSGNIADSRSLVFELMSQEEPWNDSLGDHAGCIQASAVDSQNNIYIAASNTSGSDIDWHICKYDSEGSEDTAGWNKVLDLEDDDIPHDIAVDHSDNIIVAGSIGNDSKWHVIKYTSHGDFLWQDTSYGGLGTCIPYGLAVDSENSVIIVGSQYRALTFNDWWIKKYRSDGSEDDDFGNKHANGVGVSYSKDIAYDVAVDSRDNIVVVGARDTGMLEVAQQWWIRKYSSAGDLLWQFYENYGGQNYATSVTVDSDDDIYVGGHADDLTVWMIRKYSSDGSEYTTGWPVAMSGTADTVVYSLDIDGNDCVYAAGTGMDLVDTGSGQDWLIKKYGPDSVNDIGLWDIRFDAYISGSAIMYGDDQACSISVDKNGDVYAAGYVSHINTLGSEHWFIRKISLSY